jgi:hypothetical protein
MEWWISFPEVWAEALNGRFMMGLPFNGMI